VTRPAAPSPGEVFAFIAWMRRLSDAGIRNASPAELAAFQNAKKNLIARIERRGEQSGDTE
jgi:hypothetical protein